MAQRPTLPYPYLNTIDADVDNEFHCLINDRDIITSYKFTIYSATNTKKIEDEETTFHIVYQKEVDISDNPIYGGKGNDSYLIIKIPAGVTYEYVIGHNTNIDLLKISSSLNAPNTLESVDLGRLSPIRKYSSSLK